jgi:hypothetical protein
MVHILSHVHIWHLSKIIIGVSIDGAHDLQGTNMSQYLCFLAKGTNMHVCMSSFM